MSARRPSNQDLDELIEEITVDAYDHDEQLGGFEVAFDNDATFPCPGTVIGQHVEVLSAATTNNRAELIATPLQRPALQDRPPRHPTRPRPHNHTPRRRIPSLDRKLSSITT